MSWPGAASTTSPDLGEGPLDRPTRLSEVATVLPNRRLSINNEQVERALKLLGVPFSGLPQPPFFAFLTGKTTAWHKREVALLLVESSVAINRFVTPEEADTLAFYRSNACATVSWASPIYLATATYMTQRRRSDFRFPFYTPKPASFNPSIFPHRSAPLLTDATAVGAWHVLRFFAYAAVSKIVVAGIIGAVAQTNYLMGMMSDPRLERLRKEVKERRDMALQQARGQGSHGSPAGPPSSWRRPERPPPPQKQEEQQQQQQQDWQQQDQQQQREQQQWELQQRQQEQQTAQIQQQQQQQQQQRQPHQQPPQPQPPKPTNIPNAAADDDDDSFLFDDASPVAPSQRAPPSRPSPSSPQPAADGVSAWERIRQRARAEEGAPWSRDQSQQQQQQAGAGRDQGQQTTGQYTFSQSEQEKAYAKEQAQKEFDAMLERERQGKGESGERRGRW